MPFTAYSEAMTETLGYLGSDGLAGQAPRREEGKWGWSN